MGFSLTLTATAGRGITSVVIDPTLLERVESLVSQLPEAERGDARRLVDVLRDLDHAPDARIELGRLAELLGRRAAKALPFAALARAGLAELSGDTVEVRRFSAECERWLTIYRV